VFGSTETKEKLMKVRSSKAALVIDVKNVFLHFLFLSRFTFLPAALREAQPAGI